MGEVGTIVGQLQNLEYKFDSNGLSGTTGFGNYSNVLMADEEMLKRKRKHE